MSETRDEPYDERSYLAGSELGWAQAYEDAFSDMISHLEEEDLSSTSRILLYRIASICVARLAGKTILAAGSDRVLDLLRDLVTKL